MGGGLSGSTPKVTTSASGRKGKSRGLELPGCLSEGRTEGEALKNIRDAIKLYLGKRLRGTIGVSLFPEDRRIQDIDN